MATRHKDFPNGLYFNGSKNGWSYMPGHVPHVGLGGSSKSCKHCGSLLTPPRKSETTEPNESDDEFFSALDMGMM